MKWWMEVTLPDNQLTVEGPFDSESLALDYQTAMISDGSTCVYGTPFEGSDNYKDTFPTAVSRIARSDGTEYVVLTDGTTRDLS